MRRVVKTKFPASPLISDLVVLGAAIRASRTEAGMTMLEAAMVLNLTAKTLADIELGKPSVSLGSALKVARGFGLALFVVHDADKQLTLNALQRTSE